MSGSITEIEKRHIARLSNEEASRLTKECVQTALIHLMAEKDLDQITISEIAKKAGVSRTAFYNNYASKEEVLYTLSKQLMGDLDRFALTALSGGQPKKTYAKAFQRIKEDELHFRMLLRSGVGYSDLFRVSDYVTEQYPQLDRRIRRLLFAWGGINSAVILDWFSSGMKQSVSDMAAFCADLTEDIARRIDQIDPNFRIQLRKEKLQ